MSTLKGIKSPITTKHVVPSHNPIQLAAISNYKLAQLTFAPPDLHSLRKTAVIKNMLHVVYTSTPPEWLQQMTRWQYFTPESLEEMTQEGLEEIFAQYAQTIEAFRPLKPTFQYEDEFFEDEDDGQGDDLWIAEEEIEIPVIESKVQVTESIFSQPNATLSNESVDTRASSPLSEKPLPANPLMTDDTAKQARRKSGFGGKNRLSWTSDTGLTSSIVSQNLANEIMSLFDMDFSIDIKVDTAPKLPELPFHKKRRSQQRQSQDMLTSLIPAFEKIALENQLFSVVQQEQIIKPKPNLIITSVPQRSSSLKHRQELVSPPVTPDSTESKSLTKKKSILRLASLIVNKKNTLPQTPEPSPQQQTCYFNQETTPRKTSTSTVDSTTSSLWSFVSEDYQKIPPQKPLPDPPNSPDFIPTDMRRSSKKKKRTSVMEKTMSKRKSQHKFDTEDTKGLSRSKSAFIKIGNNLKTKKKIRRTSSAKNVLETPMYSTESHELYDSEENVSTSSFVKRMASFQWRIKSRKTVEA